MHLSCAQETPLYLRSLRVRSSLYSVEIQQNQRLLVIRNAFLVLILGFHVIRIDCVETGCAIAALFWSIHVFLSVEASKSSRLRCCFVIGSTPCAPLPQLRSILLLSRILGYQPLLHSTIHVHHHCPPQSASPTTRSHVKVVHCSCGQSDVVRTMTREESGYQRG